MIRLEPIRPDSLQAILSLKVGDDQKHFVADNSTSLIEAWMAQACHGFAFPFGIWADDTPVGFCMIGYDTDDAWPDAPAVARGSYSVWRLMIAREHQGKGYGRAAMRLMLDFIRSWPCGMSDTVWLSYEPDNPAARALYASFGFRETGEMDGEEVIACLRLAPDASPLVRACALSDRDFWFSLDRHLPESAFFRMVRSGTGYVLQSGTERLAILRYGLFWDTLPFCHLLYVKEGAQRRGWGRLLMTRWEENMRRQGYDLVLTSTQSDESAQAFYRALGYRDCGGLTLPFPGHEQPLELILGKPLRSGL